jgi:hypothetical protein
LVYEQVGIVADAGRQGPETLEEGFVTVVDADVVEGFT